MNDHVSISVLGERGLIDRLQQRLGPAPPFVRIGIGDDAAVLLPERGMQQVVTTDSLIEGVHFRRDWTPARAIGHKALAVNLSDLAAMGAAPRAAVLSLAMPSDFRLQDFDDLIDGFAALALASGTTLVGGNMTRSPGPLVVDVTLLGSVRPRRVLLRRGAAAGDRLYVTGTVGAAAAGLAILQAGVDRGTLAEAELACLARYERPEPRVRLEGIVARTGAARAAIDLSDGLGDAAVRLADAAGLGVTVAADQVPIAPGAAPWLTQSGTEAVKAALAGGEDYEVAFAVPLRRDSRFRAAARRCPELQVTHVGTFQKTPGAWLDINGRLDPITHGYDHF